MDKDNEKTPLQRYEDGEITLQKMFNLQDEETSEMIFKVVMVLFGITTIIIVYLLLNVFLLDS